MKFKNNAGKENELIYELVIEKLPGLKFAITSRKRTIVEQFKEIVSYIFPHICLFRSCNLNAKNLLAGI